MGGGITAREVNKKLSSKGIKVSGFFVDDEFFKEKENFFCNKPLLPKSELAYNKEIDVVIAFCDMEQAYRIVELNLLDITGKYYIGDSVRKFDWDYYVTHTPKFEQTYNWLSDEKSKAVMCAYMDARMNYDLQPLLNLYEPEQYFIPEIVFRKKEVFLDCGMYDGETIRAFVKRCPNYRTILAFEPDQKNILKFESSMADITQVKVVKKALWNKKGILKFSAQGNESSMLYEEGGIEVEATSLDVVLEELFISSVTFIKMDIEGSELKALQGARNTIIRYQPKLAVCVYHKKEDLITIPQYIKGLEQYGVQYRFLLRHHAKMQQETVLYAIPIKE